MKRFNLSLILILFISLTTNAQIPFENRTIPDNVQSNDWSFSVVIMKEFNTRTYNLDVKRINDNFYQVQINDLTPRKSTLNFNTAKFNTRRPNINYKEKLDFTLNKKSVSPGDPLGLFNN